MRRLNLLYTEQRPPIFIFFEINTKTKNHMEELLNMLLFD